MRRVKEVAISTDKLIQAIGKSKCPSISIVCDFSYFLIVNLCAKHTRIMADDESSKKGSSSVGWSQTFLKKIFHPSRICGTGIS